MRLKARYGGRMHRGGLDESLKTTKYISQQDFEERLKDYHFYTFDSRCNQVIFIINDLEKSAINNEWTFLFIEIVILRDNTHKVVLARQRKEAKEKQEVEEDKENNDN